MDNMRVVFMVETKTSPDLDEEFNDWDANVGSRILWQLCNWMGVSNGALSARRQ